MNRRESRAVLGVEALECRKVLSTGSARVALDLRGMLSGVPSTVVGNPDVGTTVNFRGAGDLPGVGEAKLTGSLNGTGFFESSRVEGTITLAVGKSSVGLRLQGPIVGRFTAPGSGVYAYTVTRGTGAFQHDTGAGSIDLVIEPRSIALTFPGEPSPA
jgi:hypothetical protein